MLNLFASVAMGVLTTASALILKTVLSERVSSSFADNLYSDVLNIGNVVGEGVLSNTPIVRPVAKFIEKILEIHQITLLKAAFRCTRKNCIGKGYRKPGVIFLGRSQVIQSYSVTKRLQTSNVV